jgi:hypothetical protein
MPNSKFQIPRLKTLRSGIRDLGLIKSHQNIMPLLDPIGIWDLEFGTWNLGLGFWDLEFGICVRGLKLFATHC